MSEESIDATPDNPRIIATGFDHPGNSSFIQFAK
jgi:hypothetical protein